MMAGRWQRRLRVAIFGFALAGTLLALFYAEENWRAARAWSACRQALLAQGEVLDFPALEGPPLPPERNLAFLPFFARWGAYRIDAATGRVVFTGQTPSGVFDDLPTLRWNRVRAFPGLENYDLSAWQRCFQSRQPGGEATDPAQGVLRALERYQPLLAELAAARDAMPEGHFRREYDQENRDRSFDYGPEIKLNLTLLLRARAQLAVGRFPDALRDIELVLWLREASCGEAPVLIPMMAGAAMLGQGYLPLKNGLTAGGWGADEIARLQARLQRIDLLADYARAMRGERNWSLGAVDAILHGSDPAVKDRLPGASWRERLMSFGFSRAPSGWVIQNKIGLSEIFQRWFLAEFSPAAHRIYPERQQATDQAAQKILGRFPSPSNYLVARTAFYHTTNLLDFIADTQTQTDELIVECALRRYALAHDGRWPAGLDELTPQYLQRVPTKITDGAPWRYQLAADGKGYQLGSGPAK